jgi:hypothetical protein
LFNGQKDVPLAVKKLGFIVTLKLKYMANEIGVDPNNEKITKQEHPIQM